MLIKLTILLSCTLCSGLVVVSLFCTNFIGVFGFKPAGQFTNVVNRRLPGKRSIGSMTLRELNHFHINLKKGVFAKNLELDGNLHIKTHFLPNTYMVRMVHTNNFYEISLQISDPNIEFSTKTDIFEKWPCPKFLEMHFLARKKPLRGASTAKQRFSTYSGIFLSHSEPNLISKSFNNRIKPEIKPKKTIYQCNIPVGGPKTAMILDLRQSAWRLSLRISGS